jgi:hypothetical protein
MRSARWARTIALILGTAVAVTALPAVARTVVDFARNAGHVDGFRAVAADTEVGDRGGRLVATNRHGYLPNGIIRRARDSARLGGVDAAAYTQRCGDGAVAGFAQVPADVASDWTQVDGYGHSAFSVGPVNPGIASPCRVDVALARHISTGVYEVSLNSSLAGDCALADSPPPGQPLPAVVTPTSATPLVATFTTLCDPNDKGFMEQVRIEGTDGTPTDSAFTVVTLQPVIVSEP